jgi:pimeloyl-ACP methyl ester carboxylesterase
MMPAAGPDDATGTRAFDIAELAQAVRTALSHPSVMALAHGLDMVIRLGCTAKEDHAGLEAGEAIDICVGPQGASVEAAVAERTPAVTISASGQAWSKALATLPPPLFQSFSAWQLRNQEFIVTGRPLAIAQSRAFLESLIERWHVDASHASVADFSLEGISGRYHRVRGPRGKTADIFVESTGQGKPLLCLHTAGADARQFHGVMSGLASSSSYRTIAFDMPAHGRSMPADDWEGEDYQLDQADYVAWCVAVIEQVVAEPVTLLGCSMGAAISLVLAAQRPDLICAVVALEAPVRPRGRRNPFLNHAQVHAGWHTSAYVRGLMSPLSPLSQRRRAAWIYAQGGPGVYDGDLKFYSDEFDGEVIARAIDGARIPVVLMAGHYDFSATVADALALAGWIANARIVEMPDLGHFPMTENPAALLSYLVPELNRLAGQNSTNLSKERHV